MECTKSILIAVVVILYTTEVRGYDSNSNGMF